MALAITVDLVPMETLKPTGPVVVVVVPAQPEPTRILLARTAPLPRQVRVVPVL
jgi:hypothetical protein